MIMLLCKKCLNPISQTQAYRNNGLCKKCFESSKKQFGCIYSVLINKKKRKKSNFYAVLEAKSFIAFKDTTIAAGATKVAMFVSIGPM